MQLITPGEFCRPLTGRRIAGLRRRGKYLIVDLDDERAWVMHRRMSGNILYRTPADPPDDYVRAVFGLDDGHELRWTDLRKFGTMWLVEDATMVMESLGPEPLEAEFTPAVLRERAGKRSAPIKSVLLDQTVLAGMGNLYTDEALHYAKIHPLRPANRLKPDDWQRLHAGILRALRMGIDARGSSLGTTLRDHINVDGLPGQNQETVQRVRPRRRALLRVRHADAPDQGRRPQQRLLPEVPAGAAIAPRGDVERAKVTVARTIAGSKAKRKPRLHARPRRVLATRRTAIA